MTDEWTRTWRRAVLAEAREVGRGCRLLQLAFTDDLPFPFRSGHVVVLRHDGLRHPYTVSLADPARRTLGLLFRIVPGGRLTPFLAAATPGTPLEVSGLYHEPIATLIAPEAREVVGLSTGSGIGPLWGFSEMALAAGFDRPITLFAGYREPTDICLAPELDALQAAHPGFRWHATLTQPPETWTGLRGRVGHSAPPMIQTPRACHFHLVGNGAMLADIKAALALIGVPGPQVTSEVYFNHNAEAEPGAVQAIADRFQDRPGVA
jgi:ferredoxin-NADP reductase